MQIIGISENYFDFDHASCPFCGTKFFHQKDGEYSTNPCQHLLFHGDSETGEISDVREDVTEFLETDENKEEIRNHKGLKFVWHQDEYGDPVRIEEAVQAFECPDSFCIRITTDFVMGVDGYIGLCARGMDEMPQE